MQDIFTIKKPSQNKKEARSRASPPAAGRFCDKILFRRMAILTERFYVIGRTFLWHKKTLRMIPVLY
jgi:hypothetical protein